MSIYKSYDLDQLNELFSNFLLDSWSYSKVSAFARNEKAFEMQYVFNMYGKKSATTIAGSAYHEALQYYFESKKDGTSVELPSLEELAYNYIDNVKPNEWKLQKTTPTIAECQQSATSMVTSLLKNFYTEKAIYEDDIEEILMVEVKAVEFVTVNGVDIPIPCHAKIDLVVRTKAGKVVIIDHKSKKSYTDEKEIGLLIGIQAITYILCYESMTGQTVDEVWFVENKYSQNKDKSPQLQKFEIQVDENTRKLYEALLYEPLRKMINAISDPDYVYIINSQDNLTDMAELYDFWAKTMISEVDDFNVEEIKKELITKRLRKVRDASLSAVSPNVIRKFKENASKFITYDLSTTNMTKAEKIEHVLRTHNQQVRIAHQFHGYSSDTYLLEVSAGIKISNIYQYRLDIAAALDVTNVRISPELKVYEGKSYLSLDFSKKREGNLYWDASAVGRNEIPLGKDNFGNTVMWDLNNHSVPHMLVCGATGSGKSAFLHAIIMSATKSSISDIVIFDPKFEFAGLVGGLPNVRIFSDIDDIELEMAILVDQMQERVRSQEKSKKTLVVFDEFADAVANARRGRALGDDRSLEENLRILLQKGRSTGYRVIAATQRASVKVITGDAKVNFPVQVCFRVPKEVDSKVVLDEPGAETLAGYGDGLIKSPQYKETIRFQSYFVPESVTA